MPTRWLWALAATACAPLTLRTAALAESAGRVSAVDVTGFASDLGVSLLAAAAGVALAAVHRVLALLLALVWLVGHYANYELVVVLGAPATLRDLPYLFDPTFFAGSAVAVSAPGLLAWVVVGTLGFGVAGVSASRARAGAVAGLGLVGVGVAAALPTSAEHPDWRQASFLQRDAVRLVAGAWSGGAGASAGDDPPTAMLARLPELAGDLGGAPRIAPEPRAGNVLLVVLESLSGIHLESFAREHGREADAALPRIEAFAQQSLRYVSFVAHQRKTNRGLYALLCGELPNLGDGTPKMSAAAAAPWRECLPALLRDAGYQTAYLQAAPLAFMLKDRFMPGAGFEAVDGHDWFGPAYTRSAWGVDDRAFFEQALRRVAELREAGEPWFLTLLNVGTHHPYAVPDDFQPGRPRSFRRAGAYLDAAFGAFLAELEASGVLEDTLLVVTSDEAAGIAGFQTQPAFKMLSQNWGVLLLRGPGVAPGVVSEPFGLFDLPLSIADYLGLAEGASHFHGRSVLRRYARPRHLFFGNVNLGSVGAFEPEGTLLACGSGGTCRRYPVPGGRWFGVLPEPAAAPPDEPGVALLRDLAERSAPAPGRRPNRYALLGQPNVELADDRPHMLHGGQFVHLEADEWLEVVYEVELRGDAASRVDLVHALTGHKNEGLVRRHVTLRDGQHLELAYRYAPEGAKGQIQCRTTVRLVEGERATLHHSAARLEIRRGGERPAVGAQVDRFEVAGG